MDSPRPKLYYELAEWFTTLTAPEDYEEEAALYHNILQQASTLPPKTVLELGCGSGNNALHLKQHYSMILVDLSPQMVAESQKQNPNCEHHVGDMRTVRLQRQFDAIFIHDAIDYMLTLDDLHAALETAATHCKPGGTVLVVPDCTRETFIEYTTYGGHDKPKSLRYLEWVWQPEPGSRTYIADFTYLMRAEGTEMRCIYDRHICGLFSQNEWLTTFASVGLDAQVTQSPIEGEGGTYQPIFTAKKRR